MNPRALSLSLACFSLTTAALSALSCSESEGAPVDAPCNADEDCADGLICEAHGGEPSCQEPHGHSGPTSTSAASGTGGSGGNGAGGAGGQGGAGDPCETYCACLESVCSSFTGYPHANGDACMTSCAALSQEELTCWSSSCVQASEAVVAKEHLCEHAWGGAGLDEC